MYRGFILHHHTCVFPWRRRSAFLLKVERVELAHSVQYKTTKQYASKKLLDKTRWCQKVYDLSVIVFYILGQ